MKHFLYRTYTILGGAAFICGLPPFWLYTRLTGRHSKHFKERLGYVPSVPHETNESGAPRIWIHAVSLGEVKVAVAIVSALRAMIPDCKVILSTTTEHGRELAQEMLGGVVTVTYGPLDFVGSVRLALARVRPDVLVFLETEIWPAWLTEATRMGIKTALVNGRVSARSIGAYLKLRPFFQEVLNNVDAFSMSTEQDAARIRAMGAAPAKVEVNGNAKYDMLPEQVDLNKQNWMERLFDLDEHSLVFIAGSTREGEEGLILEAYHRIIQRFPQTILIIAPRHVERAAHIKGLLGRRGISCQFRSQLEEQLAEGMQNEYRAGRSAQAVIVDTFGELFAIYSVASVVFCGASLTNLGGQNPFEPAAWGKPVLYGPSMEDFADVVALLEEAGAGAIVNDANELAEKVIWLLEHTEERNNMGVRARNTVQRHQHAARNHSAVIARLAQRSNK